MTAEAPSGSGQASIDLSGGSWNSASGYLSQNGETNFGYGDLTGGANAWGQGQGQTVVSTVEAESESVGSASYNVDPYKKKAEENGK